MNKNDRTMMDFAKIMAERSTCSRLNVGAVIARNGRCISTGYNGAPSGLPHCVHETNTACDIAVHAEVNAIAFAARYGIVTDAADIFVTHSPCLQCAKLIINAGIVHVYYEIGYRDPSGLDLLRAAQVTVIGVNNGND